MNRPQRVVAVIGLFLALSLLLQLSINQLEPSLSEGTLGGLGFILIWVVGSTAVFNRW